MRFVRRVGWIFLATLAACVESPAPDGQNARTSQGHAALTEAAIAWPSRGGEDRDVLARLTVEHRTAVGQMALPVLLPGLTADDALRTTAFIAQDAFYSLAAVSEREVASGAVSTATITLQGTRKLLVHDGMPAGGIAKMANRTYRGLPAIFTINEGIMTATWLEFGISYSIDVECSLPQDSRCGSDAYLSSLVESLRFVGGRR